MRFQQTVLSLAVCACMVFVALAVFQYSQQRLKSLYAPPAPLRAVASEPTPPLSDEPTENAPSAPQKAVKGAAFLGGDRYRGASTHFSEALENALHLLYSRHPGKVRWRVVEIEGDGSREGDTLVTVTVEARR